MRFTKGQFAFIVATHTDRAHIHNHVIFNSTSIDGTRKFQDFHHSGLALQKLSDIICLENKLSVIVPKPYRERKKMTPYPKKVRPCLSNRLPAQDSSASPLSHPATANRISSNIS